MYRIKIKQDTDPSNPRIEYDHVCTMACWHRRYDLGDEQPDINPVEYRIRLALDAGVLDNPCTCHHEDSRSVDPSDDTEDTCYRCGGSFAERDKAEAAFDAHFVSLPLYLYDHSGITISTGSFSCPWDSGQVGFIYVSRAKALDELGTDDIERIHACMKAEVETYDQYLTGEVYGFIVESGIIVEKRYPTGHIEHEIEWEYEDSCWGFYGNNPDESGMSDHVDSELHALLKAAADDIGDWVYSDAYRRTAEMTNHWLLDDADYFVEALETLCANHGVTLFFGNGPAQLWIDGEHAGQLQDMEGSPGLFEVLPHD